MSPNFKKLLVSIAFLATIATLQHTAIAQDTGPPALQSIAFYTVGGGVGGALLGVAYWALDPLAPSANLRGAALQGMGVGVFGGFIFGVMQLSRQAVLPYREEIPTNEFQGDNTDYYNQKFQFSLGAPKKSGAGITLYKFSFKF